MNFILKSFIAISLYSLTSAAVLPTRSTSCSPTYPETSQPYRIVLATDSSLAITYNLDCIEPGCTSLTLETFNYELSNAYFYTNQSSSTSSLPLSTSLDASSAYCVTDSTDSGLGLLSCRGAENQNYEFLCPSCGGGGPQFGTSCLVKLVEADLCITGNKSGEELNLTKCDFSFSDATQVYNLVA